MNKIEILIEPEFTILVLAINHYITTADQIGQAFAITSKDSSTLAVSILVNKDHPIDFHDFELFRSRLHVIGPHLEKMDLKVKLKDLCHRQGKFECYELQTPNSKAARFSLAGVLTSTRFPVRWGSPKPYVDAFFRQCPSVERFLKLSEAIVEASLDEKGC